MGIVEKFFNTYAEEYEAVVVVNDVNRYYFCGYETSFGVLLLTHNKNYFITDLRYSLEAQTNVSKEFEIVERKGFSGAIEFIAQFVENNSIQKLGYEGDTVLHSEYVALKAIGAKLVSVSDKINKMRSIKSEEELTFIRTAVEIADKAFLSAVKKIKSGVTERDIAIELEYQAKLLGASDTSFDTIVAFGDRTACPHAHPSAIKLEKNTPILVDFGVKYNHYCSDMTRVLSFGEPSSKIKALHSAVLSAQKYALGELRSGITGREADSFAREYLNARGLGDNFTHSLGHGVGLEIHEAPTLSYANDEELIENMVVTVEPGAYINGVGGVRIEDTVIIKQNGIELLNNVSKDIIIL